MYLDWFIVLSSFKTFKTIAKEELSGLLRKLKLYIRQCYGIILSVEKIQKVKAQR